MGELGLWDSSVYDPGIQYNTVYSDKQRAEFRQDFDIDDSMSLLEKQLEEPACCHYWRHVDN